jgi:ribosome-associated heat shock protein Hsp15
VRIDKWLWAARFFKTRSLAQQAVEGGKVRLNGERTKPAKELKLGDSLSITVGRQEWAIKVVKLASQRAAAPIARTLYDENEESRARRELEIARRRSNLEPATVRKGRPTKRDRRDLQQWNDEIGSAGD